MFSSVKRHSYVLRVLDRCQMLSGVVLRYGHALSCSSSLSVKDPDGRNVLARTSRTRCRWTQRIVSGVAQREYPQQDITDALTSTRGFFGSRAKRFFFFFSSLVFHLSFSRFRDCCYSLFSVLVRSSSSLGFGRPRTGRTAVSFRPRGPETTRDAVA